jgi:hypothetical protein
MSRRRSSCALGALAIAVGCATEPETIGALPTEGTSAETTGSGPDPDATLATSEADGATADTAATATADTTGAAGPVVRVHVRATAERWPHTDGLSGQTPREFSAGIRSLTLLDTSGRAAELLVFDHAPAHVVAGFDDGDDTILAEVTAASLPAATFDRARVALSFVRFTVDATVHVADLSVPGEVAATQVLADATDIDGDTRDLGYWQWVFVAGANRFPVGGDTGSPVEMLPPGGPLEMAIEDGETVVYFPVSVLVDPSVSSDVDAVLEVNVHESFRWQDEARDAAYAEGVFDARPPAFEPLGKLGVNSWTLMFD